MLKLKNRFLNLPKERYCSGFISDIATKIFGGGGEEAALEGAKIQFEATEKAASGIDKRFEETRADLAPFKDLGTRNISRLESLITDPKAQLAFIEDNPFFKALTERSTRTLLNNQAAKGKVGSGETAEALQNSLLLLGSDLLNNNIAQTSGLVTTGQNAATRIGEFGANAQTSISDLITQGANAQAAGLIGAAENRANATQALFDTVIRAGSAVATGGLSEAARPVTGTQSTVALSDIRFKKDIIYSGQLPNGIPLCFFKYIGESVAQQRVSVWRFGTLAQAVEKILPQAVININGVKYVNYSMIVLDYFESFRRASWR